MEEHDNDASILSFLDFRLYTFRSLFTTTYQMNRFYLLYDAVAIVDVSQSVCRSVCSTLFFVGFLGLFCRRKKHQFWMLCLSVRYQFLVSNQKNSFAIEPY